MVLFCLVIGILPQILRNNKTAVLMHFGVKKLKFDQNGLTWFMIWTAEKWSNCTFYIFE